jgi:hypothetical protein
MRPGDAEAEIEHQLMVARAARARYEEITQDALPWANFSWGANRLRDELNNRGFALEGPTRRAPGLLFRNSQTEEEVRIMERPVRWPYSTDPPEKFYFSRYYRYKPGRGQTFWFSNTHSRQGMTT